MRLLLLQVRDGEKLPELDRYTKQEQAYHAALLIDDGYVDGEAYRGNQGEYDRAIMTELTSRGHDLLERWEGRSSEAQNADLPQQNLAIFISHAAIDKKLAESLIELLRASIRGLSEDDIRCTSVAGYGFEAGVETDARLRTEVNSSVAFIGLITPSSIQSAYVLFELGARWGARLHLAPVVAGGNRQDLLRGPLTGLHVVDGASDGEMHVLVGEIAKKIGRTSANAAVYSKALQSWLAACGAAQPESPSTATALTEDARQRFLKKTAVVHLATFGTTTTKAGNRPAVTKVHGKKEPIQVLLFMVEMLNSEDDVTAVCTHLRDNTEWADPFVLYEKEYGQGAFLGKRLKFLQDLPISGWRIKSDEDALRYIASPWADRNELKPA